MTGPASPTEATGTGTAAGIATASALAHDFGALTDTHLTGANSKLRTMDIICFIRIEYVRLPFSKISDIRIEISESDGFLTANTLQANPLDFLNRPYHITFNQGTAIGFNLGETVKIGLVDLFKDPAYIFTKMLGLRCLDMLTEDSRIRFSPGFHAVLTIGSEQVI